MSSTIMVQIDVELAKGVPTLLCVANPLRSFLRIVNKGANAAEIRFQQDGAGFPLEAGEAWEPNVCPKNQIFGYSPGKPPGVSILHIVLG